MANDAAIRDGLVVRLQAITGLSAYDHVPGQVNTPAAIVSRRLSRFDAVMADGADDYEYVITVLIPYAEPSLAQAAMSEYLARTGTKSIKAAVEGDRTLAGVVHFARVREAGEEEIREVNANPHLAVDFVVEVTG